ncbi:MAG: flagellar assembly protein FliH [Alcaligenaceae bacterium]|nr:flagellar assembly protein FliH [Alcaligenaceae bacterium]
MSRHDKPAHDLHTRASWQRWEMESLDALKARARAPGSRLEKLEDDPIHRATLARARKEGSAKGYEAGYERGRREGHAVGLAQGRAEGREQGLTEGHAQGHENGLQAGLAEGAEAARAEAGRIHDLADTLAGALDTLEADVGQSLIALSVRIAEQVLHSSLQNHPDYLIELVKELIGNSQTGDASLKLRAHPQDIAMLEQALSADTEPLRYRLIADERITRGGCIAETALGSIDATLETRWKHTVATLGLEPAAS